MANDVYPVVGEWYKNFQGQIFEVVAMDDEDNYVEIQYFGGEIDEIEFDSWDSTVAEQVEQPEDWSGPYDEMERDDLGYTDMGLRPEGRRVSIEEIE